MIVTTYTPKEVTSLMGVIDTYKRWHNFVNRKDRKYDSYHPSEWGKCLRTQQYKHYAYMGLIESPSSVFKSQILRLFDNGHYMHERWVDYFDDIGNVLMGRWRCSNPLCFTFNDDGNLNNNLSPEEIQDVYKDGKARVFGTNEVLGVFRPEKCNCGCSTFKYLECQVEDSELNMKGHADVILDFSQLSADRFKGVRTTFDSRFLPTGGQKIVGDMKTINSRAWTYQLDRKGPHKYYLIQLTIYAYILDCDYGVLMYENKDNSELKWYKVEKNDKWWEIIKWQAIKMQEMAKEKKLPPPRPLSKSEYECKNCEFKTLCHKSGIWQDSKLINKRKHFYKELL